MRPVRQHQLPGFLPHRDLPVGGVGVGPGVGIEWQRWQRIGRRLALGERGRRCQQAGQRLGRGGLDRGHPVLCGGTAGHHLQKRLRDGLAQRTRPAVAQHHDAESGRGQQGRLGVVTAREIAAVPHYQPAPLVVRDEPPQPVERGRPSRRIRGRDRDNLRPVGLAQRLARHHLLPVDHAPGQVQPQPAGEIPQVGADATRRRRRIIIRQVAGCPDPVGRAVVRCGPVLPAPEIREAITGAGHPQRREQPRLGQVLPRLPRRPRRRVGASAEPQIGVGPGGAKGGRPGRSSAAVAGTRRDRSENRRPAGHRCRPASRSDGRACRGWRPARSPTGRRARSRDRGCRSWHPRSSCRRRRRRRPGWRRATSTTRRSGRPSPA